VKTLTLLALWNSYITAAITASATSLVVKSVTDIPTAPFMALLDVGTDDEEVVKVTAVTTATKTLTIVRAQGGTTAVAHAKETLFHHCEIGAVNINLDGLAVTLAGSTALNAILLTVTDNLTCASGRTAGLKIAYTCAGIHTATGYTEGISVDITISAANPIVSGMYIHTNTMSGNHAMEMLLGIYIDLNDPGTAVNRWFAFNVDMDLRSAPLGETGMLRFRNSGTRALNSIFQIEHTNPATYLFDFIGAGNPYVSQNAATADGSLKLRVFGTDKYLALYNAAT